MGLALLQAKVDKTKFVRDESIQRGLFVVEADKSQNEVVNPRTNQIIRPVKVFDRSVYDKLLYE